jgi:hypothetical protein
LVNIQRLIDIVIGPDLHTDDVLKGLHIGFNRQLKVLVCLLCGVSFNYPGILRHISSRHQIAVEKGQLDERIEPLLQESQEAGKTINLEPYLNPTKELVDAVAGLTVHLDGARCNLCQEGAYYGGSLSTVQRHIRVEHPDVERTEESITSCGVQTLFTGHKRLYFGVYTPLPENLQFISIQVPAREESEEEESEEYSEDHEEEEEEENYYYDEPLDEAMIPEEEYEEAIPMEENQEYMPPKRIILRTESEKPIVSLHPRVAAAEATTVAQPSIPSRTPYDISPEPKRITRSQSNIESPSNETLHPHTENGQQHPMISPISNNFPPDWAYALHQEIQENRHAIARLQESVDCLIGMVYRQNTARLPHTYDTYAEQSTELRPFEE